MLGKNARKKVKEMKERLKILPRDYQVVFEEIANYLWTFAANNEGMADMQLDILEMFETGAQEGKDVHDIVGHDAIGFCDGLLAAFPEQTWMNKVKSAVSQNIDKKLDKIKRDEK